MSATLAERTEEELSWVGLAVAETIRAAELAVIALGVLLVTPPLLILAVVVIVPSLVLAAVVGAVALPVFVVRHLHVRSGERGHRLARWGRARLAHARGRR